LGTESIFQPKLNLLELPRGSFSKERPKMKCPKCQTENPDGMKFCGKCGNKLERVCPKCSFSNPPQFIFCGECGHDLGLPSKPIPKELSFEEKLAKIQRYLPKDLTQKILAQRDRHRGSEYFSG
jgi:adenylate cyclase